MNKLGACRFNRHALDLSGQYNRPILVVRQN